MVKRFLSGLIQCTLVLTIAVVVVFVSDVDAQDVRGIVPYPRDDIKIEPIDPATGNPKSTFCIGVNTIDVKLTNNSRYRKYVSVLNRDTNRIERTLYRGWLEPGTHYLSTLMRTQLELAGPSGTEMLRVDVINSSGQPTQGDWVTFYVQKCGGPGPGPWPPGPGYAQLWAWIYPYAIEQGKTGTITLQASVGSQSNVTYYFEILNSWDQLWKRLPVSKRPYERYQVKLAVGKTTKPGMLTYTVKLWQEIGFTGERRETATTRFSFRVITPGSAPTPYEPGYSWPSDPYGSGYPGGAPGWDPYGGTPYSGTPYSETPYSGAPYSGTPYSGAPYSPVSPYTMPQYGTYPYGTGYQMGTQGERSIE